VFDARIGYQFNGVRVNVDFDFGLHPDHFTFISLDHFNDHDFGHRRLGFLLRAKASLDGATALLGLGELATAGGASLLELTIDPSALVALGAALGSGQACVDDVLPRAGALFAAMTGVALQDSSSASRRRCSRLW